MDPHVECYSGGSYPERPTAFTWQAQRLDVREIVERRREPEALIFRVLAADDHLYELKYLEALDEWRIQQK